MGCSIYIVPVHCVLVLIPIIPMTDTSTSLGALCAIPHYKRDEFRSFSSAELKMVKWMVTIIMIMNYTPHLCRVEFVGENDKINKILSLSEEYQRTKIRYFHFSVRDWNVLKVLVTSHFHFVSEELWQFYWKPRATFAQSWRLQIQLGDGFAFNLSSRCDQADAACTGTLFAEPKISRIKIK